MFLKSKCQIRDDIKVLVIFDEEREVEICSDMTAVSGFNFGICECHNFKVLNGTTKRI